MRVQARAELEKQELRLIDMEDDLMESEQTLTVVRAEVRAWSHAAWC